jgi:membrane fusion protein (multidrug efflux system)
MLHLFPSSAVRAGFCLLGLSSVAFLAACGANEADSAGPAAQSQGQGRPQMAPAPVAVQAAELGDIANTYAATATLEPEAEAEMLARVAGVVETIHAEEGDEVAKGQDLLDIDNDEFRFRLDQAEARTRNLQSQHDRLVPMVEQQLVSDEEFDTVVSDLADARAAEGLARLQLSYCKVSSPFQGRVVERMVDPGQTVSVGTPLFRVADFHPLLARVHVPAKEFMKLEVDQPVRLVLDSSGVNLNARVQRVSPVIDSNSGTIKVTIEIDDYPEGIRPGDFAQVRIVTERRHDRVLVPRIAVISDKGEQVVYVARDGRAERRVVETGFADDANTEIVSGVTAGDEVVVKGQRSLRNGAPLRILEADGSPVTTGDSTAVEASGPKASQGQAGRHG